VAYIRIYLIVSRVAKQRDFRKSNDVHGTGRKLNSLFTLPEVQNGALCLCMCVCVKLGSPFFFHCFNGCNQIAEIHFSNI
jgi:hypothetical protein